MECGNRPTGMEGLISKGWEEGSKSRKLGSMNGRKERSRNGWMEGVKKVCAKGMEGGGKEMASIKEE